MNQIILLAKHILTIDISYLPDKAYDFYGFNGYESVFNKDWMDDEDRLIIQIQNVLPL